MRYLIFGLFALTTVACGGQTPTSPTPQPAPDAPIIRVNQQPRLTALSYDDRYSCPSQAPILVANVSATETSVTLFWGELPPGAVLTIRIEERTAGTVYTHTFEAPQTYATITGLGEGIFTAYATIRTCGRTGPEGPGVEFSMHGLDGGGAIVTEPGENPPPSDEGGGSDEGGDDEGCITPSQSRHGDPQPCHGRDNEHGHGD